MEVADNSMGGQVSVVSQNKDNATHVPWASL